MEQSNLIKVLLKNTNINFLLGAGTSFRPVEGKEHFPLMSDLLIGDARKTLMKNHWR